MDEEVGQIWTDLYLLRHAVSDLVDWLEGARLQLTQAQIDELASIRRRLDG